MIRESGNALQGILFLLIILGIALIPLVKI